GIERQGYMIAQPTAETVLYPRDKVLLFGTSVQISASRTFLTHVSAENILGSVFDEVRIELVRVPSWSDHAGRTIGDMLPTLKTGAQILGVHRKDRRILNPGGTEVLRASDELLVMGSPDQITAFKTLLRGS